ncbi:MAG: bifunctional 5,10-methylenetetrahydrofolate dehydrogenase/5,10-methenyltetrahydrofolate cyclohydrolase [Candidatus Kerfeldbacteria bacterium]|nr:bifunctional 5,10-methylenetetrahydrofolate dehydrogenase/5,10-methenyltetrahydrofolate cyclohydrolase [Candidatus Kerfeldbacteria bacterium]
MPHIIDGKKLAGEIRARLKTEIAALSAVPGLAIILVGDDPASHTYVGLKEKAAEDIGMHFERHMFPADTTQAALVKRINELNQRSDIHGIVVQLPLPGKSFDTDAIIQTIAPDKDVDGFHPTNIQALLAGNPRITPGLAEGIFRLIASTNESLPGKKAMIFANSPVFSNPLEYILNQHGIQTVSCAPGVDDAIVVSRQADIIVAVIGKPNFVTGEMVKDGAILIDVGFTKQNGQVSGDIAPSAVAKARWATPVPGGVGPMTVAMLLENVLHAFRLQQAQ